MNIPIIPEVACAGTRESCEQAGIRDCVCTPVLHAEVLSMLVFEPRLSDVFFDLMSEKGDIEYALVGLDKYWDGRVDRPLRDYHQLSFLEAMDLVARTGDVLIGWSPSDGKQGNIGLTPRRRVKSALTPKPKFDNHELDLNPSDKASFRTWRMGEDVLVVLRHRFAVMSQTRE